MPSETHSIFSTLTYDNALVDSVGAERIDHCMLECRSHELSDSHAVHQRNTGHGLQGPDFLLQWLRFRHDDVIKWKHFPRNWPFVREIHRSPVNFPHKGQWRGALMYSLIYAWINDWVNNHEAGDLRRQHGHYDVIVMVVYGCIGQCQFGFSGCFSDVVADTDQLAFVEWVFACFNSDHWS